MATCSSILTWKVTWIEEPGGLHGPWGCQEWDVTEHDHLQREHSPYICAGPWVHKAVAVFLNETSFCPWLVGFWGSYFDLLVEMQNRAIVIEAKWRLSGLFSG